MSRASLGSSATHADIEGVLVALDALDERWSERGLREAITSQSRVLVVSLLVSVVAIARVAFGLTG